MAHVRQKAALELCGVARRDQRRLKFFVLALQFLGILLEPLLIILPGRDIADRRDGVFPIERQQREKGR